MAEQAERCHFGDLRVGKQFVFDVPGHFLQGGGIGIAVNLYQQGLHVEFISPDGRPFSLTGKINNAIHSFQNFILETIHVKPTGFLNPDRGNILFGKRRNFFYTGHSLKTFFNFAGNAPVHLFRARTRIDGCDGDGIWWNGGKPFNADGFNGEETTNQNQQHQKICGYRISGKPGRELMNHQASPFPAAAERPAH